MIDETIHGCGKVFDRGVAMGAYTDARGITLVTFHSSDDGGYLTIFREMPTLSAFGKTREESLREFGVMLQGAIESGLALDEISYSFYLRTPSKKVSNTAEA